MKTAEELMKELEDIQMGDFRDNENVMTSGFYAAQAQTMIAVQLERLNQFLELLASGKLGGFNVK